MPSPRIRRYRTADLPGLIDVCLRTGNSGEDATHLFDDHRLLADFYATPYATLYPEFCFVLVGRASTETAEEDVFGYVIGVPDTARFGSRCETEWFPPIRSRLTPVADEADDLQSRIVHRIFAGHEQTNRFPDYPAHLHIDLLSEAQGRGWGRKLMQQFLDRLREQKIAGVHLGVGKSNTKAIGFYEHLGFELIEEEPAACVYGMKLSR